MKRRRAGEQILVKLNRMRAAHATLDSVAGQRSAVASKTDSKIVEIVRATIGNKTADILGLAE